MQADLNRVRGKALACTDCRLSAGRTQVVFGAGAPDADVMFVGEAPGAAEDGCGLPFRGRSGRLLDRLLDEVGLSRESVWIANVVNCRPPDNRDPRPDEIAACSKWLDAQVAAVRPRVIATLGNFATRRISGSSLGITKLHGEPIAIEFAGIDLIQMPLFHPAAALRSRSTLSALRDDMQRLAGLVDDQAA